MRPSTLAALTNRKLLLVLAVCVTDDTFQHIWYVNGADLLVVPSNYTQCKYVEYGQRKGNMMCVEVVPYPVHPRMGEKLDKAQLVARTRIGACPDASLAQLLTGSHPL